MNGITANSAKLERRYTAIADRWGKRMDALGYPQAYRELLRQTIGNGYDPDWSVLDAGTGCGTFSEALVHIAGSLRKIELLDISAKMLAQAVIRLRPHIAEIRTQCDPLDVMDRAPKYDLILCAHVIEHCADPRKTIATLHDTLRPGGRMVLVASKPHLCTSLIRLIWRHKAFPPCEMARLLADAGFAEITLHPLTKGPPNRTSFGYFASKPHSITKEMP